MSAPGAREFVVETPERVFFRYELAGPMERVAAFVVDAAFMGALFLLAGYLLGAAGRFGTPLLLVAIFLIQWGYFLFFEWRWNGATPGKRFLGIRVIQSAGVRCSFERLALRNFLRVVDSQPFLYALGGLVMLLHPRGQRLGDLAAGTVCVRVPPRPPVGAVAEITTRWNSIRDDEAARRRVRLLLGPRESELVVDLALRRELLDRDPRQALFARAAGYLRRRLRLVGHEGLSDERLVLNVAAVVLQDKVL